MLVMSENDVAFVRVLSLASVRTARHGTTQHSQEKTLFSVEQPVFSARHLFGAMQYKVCMDLLVARSSIAR